MYGRSRVNIKVEPSLNFTFTRGLSNITSILFTRENLHAYARKNYLTVEIHPKVDRRYGIGCGFNL